MTYFDLFLKALKVLPLQQSRAPSSELKGYRIGYSPQHLSAGPFEIKVALQDFDGFQPLAFA